MAATAVRRMSGARGSLLPHRLRAQQRHKLIGWRLIQLGEDSRVLTQTGVVPHVRRYVGGKSSSRRSEACRRRFRKASTAVGAIHTAPLQKDGGEVHFDHMKLYKIEKGIKLPAPSRPKSTGQLLRAAATMRALAVGDSFFIRDPLDAIRAEKTMRDMNASARSARRPQVMTSRRVKGGLRVWRVEQSGR